MTQQYQSFKGTAKQMQAAGVKVNGAAVDAVGLCIMARYGVAKIVGKDDKPSNVKGRAGAIFLLQGKSGFRVEVPALVEQTQEEKEVVTV